MSPERVPGAELMPPLLRVNREDSKLTRALITTCPQCRKAIRLSLGRQFRCTRPNCGVIFTLQDVEPTLGRFGLSPEVEVWLTRPCPPTSGLVFWVPLITAALLAIGLAGDHKAVGGLIGLCVGGFSASWLHSYFEKQKQRRHRQSIEADPRYPQRLRYQQAAKDYSDFVASVRRKEDEELKAQERKEYETLRTTERWWRSLDGRRFEKEFALLCERQGYSVDRRGGPGDGGVDLVLRLRRRTIVVQCKAHQKYIPPGTVRDLYGTLVHNEADEAWLVSTHGFHKGSYEFARGKPIRLLTIREILKASRS